MEYHHHYWPLWMPVTIFDSSQVNAQTLNSYSTSQSNEILNSKPRFRIEVPNYKCPSRSSSPSSDPLRNTGLNGSLKDPKAIKRTHDRINTEAIGLPAKKKKKASLATRDLGPIREDLDSPRSKRERKFPEIHGRYVPKDDVFPGQFWQKIIRKR